MKKDKDLQYYKNECDRWRELYRYKFSKEDAITRNLTAERGLLETYD